MSYKWKEKNGDNWIVAYQDGVPKSKKGLNKVEVEELSQALRETCGPRDNECIFNFLIGYCEAKDWVWEPYGQGL